MTKPDDTEALTAAVTAITAIVSTLDPAGRLAVFQVLSLSTASEILAERLGATAAADIGFLAIVEAFIKGMRDDQHKFLPSVRGRAARTVKVPVPPKKGETVLN